MSKYNFLKNIFKTSSSYKNKPKNTTIRSLSPKDKKNTTRSFTRRSIQSFFNGKVKNSHSSRSKSIKNSPKKKMLVGKIYADWCGHCVSLKPEWAKLKNMIKHNMGRSLKNVHIEFVEIGDTEENKSIGKTVDNMIHDFNNKHMSNSPTKLALDGGYPTVFKHCHGKLEYYKGERNAAALYKWYTAGC